MPFYFMGLMFATGWGLAEAAKSVFGFGVTDPLSCLICFVLIAVFGGIAYIGGK